MTAFLIADTFTASLARLSGDEQKAAKITALDLQLDPASPGMQLHRLDRAKDKSFWSVRVNRDLRLIVHRTAESLLLCYVGHHGDAYRWAESRRLERHPTTGAAQIVEVRETVREIEVPRYVAPAVVPPVERATPQERRLFDAVDDERLLAYGVPSTWIGEVREATEATIFDVVEHLPAEAAEALIELATGGSPVLPVQTTPETDPFAHPDAQRRFRVMTNVEELELALSFPWEKWSVFLHPAQRELVEREYGGPARVAGSAGTGKTVVGLHRGVHLARKHDGARVLLATFSEPLAAALRVKLERLIGNQPRLRERIEVDTVRNVARRLARARLGPTRAADDEQVRELLRAAAKRLGVARFSDRFLWSEWRSVVDEWQLGTWEEYRTVQRLGRKTRLPEAQRQELWRVFEEVRAGLAREDLLTEPALLARVTAQLAASPRAHYDFAVVDEAQDLGVPELRFLAALGGGRPDALFFAGDLGQRIFQAPFSWLSLGVDVRGRSHTLRINYRTSHQIRSQADRLLPAELSDVDGTREDRRGTISVFNGPDPEVRLFADAGAEARAVGTWLDGLIDDGFVLEEIALFVRTEGQVERARAAAEAAGLQARYLEDRRPDGEVAVAVGTMHLAKGLEFRAVAVLACDDEVLPLQSRIEAVADTADLEDVYDTERHLLYVACTRARDRLLVTCVEPGSEFLEDLISRSA